MVLGIIAEYNPFSNGHLYHLNKSKEKTGCNYTVAVISGNFTQRGSTSIVNKWEKTKMALANGVDLIIELPTLYATSSAENFADGAVKIFDSLGIIDYLSFGSEIADMNVLNEVADVLLNEPAQYKNYLKLELKSGVSFPEARENAIIEYFNNTPTNISKSDNILSLPNNTLGIEYLKALKKYNSNIKPICIKRFGTDYNSKEVFHRKNINILNMKSATKNNIGITNMKCDTEGNVNIENNEDLDKSSSDIASATAIRNFIRENDFEKIKKVIPQSSYDILVKNFENGHIIQDLSIFEKEIFYKINLMSTEKIANIADVNEGLEFSIKKAASTSHNFEEFVSKIKSKRYTYTRIQRILLHILLDITKYDIEISKKAIPYVRVLGFNDNGKKLVSDMMKKNPNLNVVTSVRRFENSLNFDKNKSCGSSLNCEKSKINSFDNSLNLKSSLNCNNNSNNLKILLGKDILATNIYTLGYKSDYENNLDYKMPIIATRK